MWCKCSGGVRNAQNGKNCMSNGKYSTGESHAEGGRRSCNVYRKAVQMEVEVERR